MHLVHACVHFPLICSCKNHHHFELLCPWLDACYCQGPWDILSFGTLLLWFYNPNFGMLSLSTMDAALPLIVAAVHFFIFLSCFCSYLRNKNLIIFSRYSSFTAGLFVSCLRLICLELLLDKPISRAIQACSCWCSIVHIFAHFVDPSQPCLVSFSLQLCSFACHPLYLLLSFFWLPFCLSHEI